MMKKDNARNFAYFKSITKNQYDQLRGFNGDSNVDDETICFVSDTGKIYTQGKEFGGSSSEGKTYTGSTYINVDNSANTISLSTNNLLNWINQLDFGGGGATTLSGLSDVELGSGSHEGKVLKYSNGKWRAGVDNEGTGSISDDPTIIDNTQTIYVYANAIADLNPDSIIVGKKNDGNNYLINAVTTASLYSTRARVDATITGIQFDSVSSPNGNAQDIANTISVSRLENNKVQITIPEDSINFSNLGNVLDIKIKIEGTVDGVNVIAYTTFSIYVMDASGTVVNGENGVSYKIVVPGAVSADSNNGNIIYPDTIKPFLEICRSTGTTVSDIVENTTKLYASDITGDYKLKYKFDNGNWISVPTGTNEFNTNISGIPQAENDIYVALVNEQGTTIGLQRIPIIKTGKNGLNGSGLHYEIQPSFSTVHKYKNQQNQYRIGGEIGFIFIKVLNGGREIVTDFEDGETEFIANTTSGRINTVFSHNPSTGVYYCDIDTNWDNGNTLNNYVEILAKNTELNNRLASIIIPVRIDGEDGTTTVVHQVQALLGEVIRMRGQWVQNPDPSYKDGNTPEDGVNYVDVVSYAGYYFRCTVAETQSCPITPVTSQLDDAIGTIDLGNGPQEYKVNTGWSVFSYMPDGIYQYLIAKNAFVENLTAEQIVITDNNNIVAGMVNGHYVSNDTSLSSNGTDNGVRIWAGPMENQGNVASAPFTVDNEGNVRMISTVLGRLSGLHMKIVGNSIEFWNGDDTNINNKIAYFYTEGLGLQLFIKNANGVWHKIDFSYWDSGVLQTDVFRLLSIGENPNGAGVQTIYYRDGENLYYSTADLNQNNILNDSTNYYRLKDSFFAIDGVSDPDTLIPVSVYEPIDFVNGIMSVSANRSSKIIAIRGNNNIMYADRIEGGMNYSDANAQLYSYDTGRPVGEDEPSFGSEEQIIGAKIITRFSANPSDLSGEITKIYAENDTYFAEDYTI